GTGQIGGDQDDEQPEEQEYAPQQQSGVDVNRNNDVNDPPVPVDQPVPERANDNFVPLLHDLKIAHQFKLALENASLSNGDLDDEQIHLLQHPLQEPARIDDRDLLLSIKLFISTTLAANKVYEDVRLDIMDIHPEDKILSHDAVKKAIAKLTGVLLIVHDMCLNSCMAYTGPWSVLEYCPFCNAFRYDPILFEKKKKKVAQRHFYTLPLGFMLQAKYRTAEGAHNMKHRQRRTAEICLEIARAGGVIEVYEDLYHGSDYIKAVECGDISTDDMILIFSMDGAQLYADKQSDCWIYIWVIGDLPPDLRYKKRHVIPGGFIPGPNNPKHPESFVFPGAHHLAAIQKTGLCIWDAETGRVFVSRPFFYLGAADGPGSVHFTGLVGHHGAYPCRLYCPVKGRHKPGGSHYYPALLKPLNYMVEGCEHDDIHPGDIVGGSAEEYEKNLFYLLNSRNPTDYKERRKDSELQG
ncbi:hypothetical protein H0H92_011113, partial [Tricholoma furcatifolium]